MKRIALFLVTNIAVLVVISVVVNLLGLGRADANGLNLGRGRDAALIGAVERQVAAKDGRIVLIETSGLGSFEGQRALYKRLGYAEEARIRDFYEPGNDKVVFWKSLTRLS